MSKSVSGLKKKKEYKNTSSLLAVAKNDFTYTYQMKVDKRAKTFQRCLHVFGQRFMGNLKQR